MDFSLAAIAYGSIVGLSLGLTGAGGSILAIPLLVYGLDIPMPQAIVMSLLMVGSIALFGAARQSSAGNVDWRSAVLFSLTGMILAPIVMILARDVDETIRLLSFALLMLFVAYKMAFSSQKRAIDSRVHQPTSMRAIKTAAGGAVAGALSGFFGVGGGFIIVPLLTMIFSIPYRKAVGTSLAAIFLISVTAIASAFLYDTRVDWALFLMFIGGGLAGMLVGSGLVNLIPEKTAKITFAAITATLAVFMLIDRLFIHQGGFS